MSVKESDSLSRANGAWLVVDYLSGGWELIKKKSLEFSEAEKTKHVP